MNCSVVVTTYNDPSRLALVLEGLARQSVPPLEILVADDGSRPETGELVRSWKTRMPVPLVHVWHEDRGYRKTRICNLATLESSGERLVFLDGDSVPHSRWVEDHALAHARADVLCGRRVKLGPMLTSRLDAAMVRGGRLECLLGPVLASALRGDTERWSLGLRIPAPLARILHPRPRRLMGVNFSISRRAFELVNGYDNEWSERREDRELELRLLRAGVSFASLLNRAIVYHLHHRVTVESDELLDGCRSATHVRCASGLDQLRGATSVGRQ